MPLNSYTKKPNELKIYSIDYTNWLQDGETITNVSVTVQDNTMTNPLLVDNSVDIPSNLVTISVSGGDDGDQYSIVVQITTSLTQIKEDCIAFYIQGDC
jgi:hypothetical protein